MLNHTFNPPTSPTTNLPSNAAYPSGGGTGGVAGCDPQAWLGQYPIKTTPLPQPSVESPFKEPRVYLVRGNDGLSNHVFGDLQTAEREADLFARKSDKKVFIFSLLETVITAVPIAVWQHAQ